MVAAETRRTVAGMAAFVGIPCHRWAAVDVETTGFDPRYGRVVEIGVILVDDGRVTDIFDTLINPGIGPGPIHRLADWRVRSVALADPAHPVGFRAGPFSVGLRASSFFAARRWVLRWFSPGSLRLHLR